jgi:Kyakuja-Dileera-Zisupton transposase
MCQYWVHFKKTVKHSPGLSISSSLEIWNEIGLFHIHGHQDSCLPWCSPSYFQGVKQVNGEIIKTLWASLNNISQCLRGVSLAHQQEVLDAHISHSNWKEMVQIGEYSFPCAELNLTSR